MKKLKVLVADDEIMLREGISRYLDFESIGMEVVATAANGHEALEYIERNSVDILLTDIRMPTMDGITLLETLAARDSNILAIVISAYNDQEYVIRALRTHLVYDFILKPLDLTECTKLLDKAGRHYHSTRTALALDNFLSAKPEPTNRSFDEEVQRQQLKILSLAKTSQEQLLFDAVDEYFALFGDADLALAQTHMADLLVRIGFLMLDMGLERAERFDYLVIIREVSLSPSLDALKDLCIDYIISSLPASTLSQKNNASSALILTAKTIVENKYGDPNLSLALVAREIGVSANHLSTCFKMETGIRFTRYLNLLRIDHARTLLEDARYRIYEIAELVGLSNTRYFSKLFREYTGITPSEYRKKIKS